MIYQKVENKLKKLTYLCTYPKSEEISVYTSSCFYLGFLATGNVHYYNNFIYSINIGLNSFKESVKLKMMLFEFYIETHSVKNDNVEKATYILKQLQKEKKLLKNKNGNAYIFVCYAQASLFLISGKKVKAEKMLKKIEGLVLKEKDGNSFILMGILSFRLGNCEGAMGCFSKMYRSEDNNPYVYLYSYKLLNSVGFDFDVVNKLLVNRTLNWASKSFLDIENILRKQRELLEYSLDEASGSFLLHLIDRYNYDLALKVYVTKLIEMVDYSSYALKFYVIAEKMGLEIQGLHLFILQSALKNNYEEVSLSTLLRFLNNENKLVPEDEKINSGLYFVFHLAIINQYELILSNYRKDIYLFCVNSLYSAKKGLYFNTIYMYIFNELLGKKAKDFGENVELFHSLESLIKINLFKYQIILNTNKVKTISVVQEEKAYNERFILNPNETSTFIYLSSDNFNLEFYDGTFKLQENVVYILKPFIHKKLINSYFGVIDYFYELNKSSLNAIIFMVEKIIEGCCDSFDEIEKLKSCLTNDGLSNGFKMRISSCIGNFYSDRGEFEIASNYYRDINLSELERENVDVIIQAYLASNKYEKVLNIILKNSEKISFKTLFLAVKKLIEIDEYGEMLAVVCYNLLVNSWYDKEILDIVVNYFTGELYEFKNLSETLFLMGISEKKLNEKILEMAIKEFYVDDKIENIMINYFENITVVDILENIIFVSCVEMFVVKILKDNYLIKSKSISIFERIYGLKCKSDSENSWLSLVHFALGKIYLEENYSTENTEKIIRKCLEDVEKKDIFFPFLKKIKDKSQLSTYIIANQPFQTFGRVDGEIYFMYMFEHEKKVNNIKFRSKKMLNVGNGIFLTSVPTFFGEIVHYYFEEKVINGSVGSEMMKFENRSLKTYNDFQSFYTCLNNAIIYENTFKFSEVEEIINNELNVKKKIYGKSL